MDRNAKIAVLALAVMLFPAAAFAHVSGAEHAHGMGQGLLHPLTGVDHLAAMLGIGLWAALRPGASMWLVPAGFVAGMAAGLLSGVTPLTGAAETGIILSLVTLGAMLAFAVKLPAWTSMALAAAAGLFHGAAHAAEAPEGFASFAIGALATTALLHAAGGFAGLHLRKQMRLIAPAAGVILAALGVGLAVQAI